MFILYKHYKMIHSHTQEKEIKNNKGRDYVFEDVWTDHCATRSQLGAERWQSL